MKIYLSPSNQTENTYAVGSTNEAAQCRAIADAAEIAFLRCGFQVRKADNISMYEAVAESNAFGADYHLCIHTNAFDGNVAGTRLFCFDGSGEGYKACCAVMESLSPITPGTSDNITPNPGLYEVRAAAGFTVYIEVGFHDHPDEAAWITQNTTQIAESICMGMCRHCGIDYVPDGGNKPAADSQTEVDKIYRVQVGAYRNYANAVRVRDELIKAGYVDAFIRVAE